MISEEQIKARAYAIWKQEGCPDGKDIEHYFRAKQILEEEEAATYPKLPDVKSIKIPPLTTPRKD